MTEHARLAQLAAGAAGRGDRKTARCCGWRPGVPRSIDEVPSGRIHMDGKVLVEEGQGLARGRRSLAFAGLIAITIALDAKGRVAGEPSILFEGVPEPVHGAVREAVDGAIKRYNPKRGDDEALKETLRRSARRAASDAWGKKPVTRVEVVWV